MYNQKTTGMGGTSRMDIKVRRVELSDAGEIVSILNPIIHAGIYTVFDTPFSVEAEQAYIKSFPERGIFNVAADSVSGVLYGFQSMEPFATYTHAFDHVGVVGTYVRLGNRRQGISKHLFEATFAEALHKGYEKIFTFVRADNPAALATYQSQGFRIVGTAERQAKVNGGYVDEIIIEKFLR